MNKYAWAPLFDGRNVVGPVQARAAGFEYTGIRRS